MKKQVATTLSKQEAKALEEFCARTDRSVAKYIRRAIIDAMTRDGIIAQQAA